MPIRADSPHLERFFALGAGQTARFGRGTATKAIPSAGGGVIQVLTPSIRAKVDAARAQLASVGRNNPQLNRIATGQPLAPAPMAAPPRRPAPQRQPSRPLPAPTFTPLPPGGGSPFPFGGPILSDFDPVPQPNSPPQPNPFLDPTPMIPNTNFAPGPVIGSLASSGCDMLPAQLQGACNAINNQIFPSNPGTQPGEATCPEGTVNQDGQCVETGFRGQVERFLPGGQTGTLSDLAGAAVTGAFGLPARYPAQVGQIMKGAGSPCGAQMVPILRCPRGMRLGDDDLCYVKGTRGVVWKHAKPARPLLSSRDGKILRKAKSLEKKLKRVAGEFVPKPRRAPARKC